MAVQDGLAFWNALKGKIQALIKQENSNSMKCARYDVTTAPNGSVIGVRLPEGATEILIPYSKEVEDAIVGDTVLVVWHGTLSTAKAYYYGNGYEGYVTPTPPQQFVEYMNVYADVGSTVTAVCGETTYTGTISSAGHLTFTCEVAGTYTVTASLSGVTHTQTISMTVNGATQNIDLRSTGEQFIAYLTVSTNPNADVTVEHSTSGTSYSGTASNSGVASFTIYESGTFTVYASITEGNTSKTINISTNGYMYNIDVTVVLKNCYLYAVGNSGETLEIADVAGTTFANDEELKILTLHIGGLLSYGTGGTCLALGNYTMNGIDESITPYDFRCSKWNFCAFMYGRTDPYAIVIADDGNGHRFEGTATKSGYVCFVTKNSGTYTVTSSGVTGTQTATLYVQDNSTIYRFDFRQFDGTLYDNGDEYTKYTGGWIGDSTITVTDYDSSIYVYTSPIVSHLNMLVAQLMGGPKVGSVRTVNMIDLTYYETLTIEYAVGSSSGTGTLKLFASNGTSGFNSKASTTLTNSTTKTTATLDISQLSGNYYIGIEIEADDNQSMVFNLYYASITLSETIEVSGGGGLSL